MNVESWSKNEGIWALHTADAGERGVGAGVAGGGPGDAHGRGSMRAWSTLALCSLVWRAAARCCGRRSCSTPPGPAVVGRKPRLDGSFTVTACPSPMPTYALALPRKIAGVMRGTHHRRGPTGSSPASIPPTSRPPCPASGEEQGRKHAWEGLLHRRLELWAVTVTVSGAVTAVTVTVPGHRVW